MLIDFSKLKPILPHIGGLAVFLGITKLVWFYNAFGISIVQYIDISEALILFFEDILWFLLFITVPFLLSFIFFGHSIADSHSTMIDNVTSQSNFWGRLFQFSKYYIVIIFFTILGIITGKGYEFPVFLLIVMFFLYEMRFKLKKRYNVDFDSTYHNLLWWFLINIYFGYGQLQREIKEVRETNRFENSSIILKEKDPIPIDSATLFLGHTKDYFFLYDTKSESAIILSSGEVLKVKLKNKRKVRTLWDFFTQPF